MSDEYTKELEKRIEVLESTIDEIHCAKWITGIPKTDGFYFMNDPNVITHPQCIYEFRNLVSCGEYTSTEMNRWCKLLDDTEIVDIFRTCNFYGPLIQPPNYRFGDNIINMLKDEMFDP